MKRACLLFISCLLLTQTIGGQTPAQTPASSPITAGRAGRLIDPETGTATANQVIIIDGARIRNIGTDLPIPAGAKVIDLSGLTVLPGLVDAHNHLALTPGMTRGQVAINFLLSWKAAGIPAREILKIMTTNGFKGCEIEKQRGPIKEGFFADMIAVRGNPLDDIDSLRDVQFVMKNGMVFKKDGVMTPEEFFHGGPVNGWRIR
jgi:imidazolonepropionase-like amidohydrolase